MNQYFEAFLLGNAAIVSNVCMLPLYPGMIAFLSGSFDHERPQRDPRWLGLLVLAGVLSMMLALGWLVFSLQQSFGSLLIWLLPLIYFTVIGLGGLLIAGRNPFQRFGQSNLPILRSPIATAFIYGLLLGPMTLPCTGPLIVSAFLLGGSVGALSDGLFYFFCFGLGFGWPLVVLPFIAGPLQRRFTGWLVRNSATINRAAGALLILIGLTGLWVEVLPQF